MLFKYARLTFQKQLQCLVDIVSYFHCHVWVCSKLMKQVNLHILVFLSSLYLIPRVSVADLTIHRLCNTHTSQLPHWVELVEIMGIAWYASPERIVSRLSFLLERGTTASIHTVHCANECEAMCLESDIDTKPFVLRCRSFGDF